MTNPLFKRYEDVYEKSLGYEEFLKAYAKEVADGWKLLSNEVGGSEAIQARVEVFQGKGLEIKVGENAFWPDGRKIDGGKVLLYKDKKAIKTK